MLHEERNYSGRCGMYNIHGVMRPVVLSPLWNKFRYYDYDNYRLYPLYHDSHYRYRPDINIKSKNLGCVLRKMKKRGIQTEDHYKILRKLFDKNKLREYD